MIASYRGQYLNNEAAGLVGEYIARRRLQKLGFTSRIEDLPAWKSECFCLIDAEIDDLQAKEVKKQNGRRK